MINGFLKKYFSKIINSIIADLQQNIFKDIKDILFLNTIRANMGDLPQPFFTYHHDHNNKFLRNIFSTTGRAIIVFKENLGSLSYNFMNISDIFNYKVLNREFKKIQQSFLKSFKNFLSRKFLALFVDFYTKLFLGIITFSNTIISIIFNIKKFRQKCFPGAEYVQYGFKVS